MVYSTDSNQFENDIPSDLLEALADLACEQREAMMEAEPSEFQLISYETNSSYKTR